MRWAYKHSTTENVITQRQISGFGREGWLEEGAREDEGGGD